MIEDELTNDVLNDPASSYWLKHAIRALAERDPVDSVNDVELLLEVQKRRLTKLMTDPLG